MKYDHTPYKIILLICLYLLNPFTSYTQHSKFIHVDQFGYITDDTKVAVISNPEVGFNSASVYNIGETIQLIDANTEQIVFTNRPEIWNDGNIHSQSGDRGWWLDFSAYTVPGTYYLYDPANNESSAIFEINNTVYDEILIAASKMFFYNRSYIEKRLPYVREGYVDDKSFVQDEFTRDINDPSNSEKWKDMRGGWYDAGDNNKYVTFAAEAVHNLLWAYRTSPKVFSDNFNIPESGNNIPDIIDEIKWETDWLLKMTNLDGSVHIKMGNRNYEENTQAPPSVNKASRYYASVCTSSSIASAGMLAHAANIFSQFPDLKDYADSLRIAAEQSWSWVTPYLNSDSLDTDCDDGSIVAGDADRSIEEQKEMALVAAIYLLELTGDVKYNNYISDNIMDTDVIYNSQWNNYNLSEVDALLLYITLDEAENDLKDLIGKSAQTSATSNYNNYFNFNDIDLYRAYSNDWTYHWGSNFSKSNMAVLNLVFANYKIVPENVGTQFLRANEMLHYYHGVNPLSKVFLSNMKAHGAENSVHEIYHFWFADGTMWDNADTSAYGPAPGYLSGGCNANYTANTTLQPPYDQPLQKSYLDFNTGYPDNAWEVSEPAIYYQSSYVRLLSQIINHNKNVVSTKYVNYSKPTIHIYPNPTSNSLTVSFHRMIKDVKIFNALGEILLHAQPDKKSTYFDTSHFVSGTYIVKVNNEYSSIIIIE